MTIFVIIIWIYALRWRTYSIIDRTLVVKILNIFTQYRIPIENINNVESVKYKRATSDDLVTFYHHGYGVSAGVFKFVKVDFYNSKSEFRRIHITPGDPDIFVIELCTMIKDNSISGYKQLNKYPINIWLDLYMVISIIISILLDKLEFSTDWLGGYYFGLMFIYCLLVPMCYGRLSYKLHKNMYHDYYINLDKYAIRKSVMQH